MSEDQLTDRSDEMEGKLSDLGDHIDDAEKKLAARKGDAGDGGDVAGDFKNEQDRGGGDDPVGAAEDAAQGGEGHAAGGAPTDAGAGEEDPDGLEPEEAQSPT